MHALLNGGLDKVLCRMRQSLIFATLYKVLFLEKKVKYKESIKFHTKSYKWKESDQVPNDIPYLCADLDKLL